MNLRAILIAASASLATAMTGGCTDAQRAHLTKYGQGARITCQSADVVYFDDESTGAVSQHEGGDVSFVSKTTGRLTQASGSCIVDYGGHLPDGGAIRPHENKDAI
jgi:hypothetical protein